MEEELNYANVTFKSNGVSKHLPQGKSSLTEIIYDEVKSEKRLDLRRIITENKKKAQMQPLLFLGTLCFILVLVIVILRVYFAHEQERQSSVLTKQILKLEAVNAALEKRTAELFRERNQHNWTLGVILEYDNFPVKKLCPQKVCKPCQDGWKQFQSNCYLFTKDQQSFYWNTWEQSKQFCLNMKSELVVIDSQEEQEFINNNTEKYNDDKHGYWIGLHKNTETTWTWFGGRNLSVTYWSQEEAGDKLSCGLSNPHLHRSSNWAKVSCLMKNRWICESRALIRPD